MAQAKTLELSLLPSHTCYLFYRQIFANSLPSDFSLNLNTLHFRSPSPKFRYPLPLHHCNSLTGSQLLPCLPTLHPQSTLTAPRVTRLKCNSDQIMCPKVFSCDLQSPTPFLPPTFLFWPHLPSQIQRSPLCAAHTSRGLRSQDHDTWDLLCSTEIHLSPPSFQVSTQIWSFSPSYFFSTGELAWSLIHDRQVFY